MFTKIIETNVDKDPMREGQQIKESAVRIYGLAGSKN
jgi:hypothetical protein